jgi:NAD(P)-dependent dehydrogenase (short-subunit alcohol dehydrogenase family)
VKALVTGAAGGIGRAVVAHLAGTGAAVAACDLPGALASAAPAEATAQAGFDVRDPVAVQRGVAEAREALGGLDAVVANAGVVDTIHRADRFPDEAWQGDLDANLSGAFRVAQAAWPALKQAAQDGGAPALVFVSSVAAEQGLPGQVAYAAAKAGIVGMARTLAAEWGPRGVRVNVVMPGVITTPKVRALPEAMRSGLAGSVPLRRLGAPEEVAAVIAFLLGPSAAYVHGQTIRVDGGAGLTSGALATGQTGSAS